jgi:hypothetical protein
MSKRSNLSNFPKESVEELADTKIVERGSLLGWVTWYNDTVCGWCILGKLFWSFFWALDEVELCRREREITTMGSKEDVWALKCSVNYIQRSDGNSEYLPINSLFEEVSNRLIEHIWRMGCFVIANPSMKEDQWNGSQVLTFRRAWYF